MRSKSVTTRPLLFLCFLFFSFQLLAGSVFNQFDKVKGMTVDERVKFWGTSFVGVPYEKGGPLGEGPNARFDRDPLYRFDKFDCTTYAETISALAKANSKSEFEKVLREIRYKDSVISYQTRNHITSQSWVPENISNGMYSDSTSDFPSSLVKTARTYINLPGWFKKHDLSRLRLPGFTRWAKKKRLKELQAISSRTQAEYVDLPFLYIPALIKNWKSFTSNLSGTYVMSIVRPNWNIKKRIGTNLNVSHQGIIWHINGIPHFTHASLNQGKVVTVRLKTYLGWLKNSAVTKGIHLLKINP